MRRKKKCPGLVGSSAVLLGTFQNRLWGERRQGSVFPRQAVSGPKRKILVHFIKMNQILSLSQGETCLLHHGLFTVSFHLYEMGNDGLGWPFHLLSSPEAYRTRGCPGSGGGGWAAGSPRPGGIEPRAGLSSEEDHRGPDEVHSGNSAGMCTSRSEQVTQCRTLVLCSWVGCTVTCQLYLRGQNSTKLRNVCLIPPSKNQTPMPAKN